MSARRSWLVRQAALTLARVLVANALVATTYAAEQPALSPQGFMQQIAAMRALVQACRQQSERCDPRAVPPDEQLDLSDREQDLSDREQDLRGRETTGVRWYWLRDTLAHAREAKAPEREEQLQLALARLDTEAEAPAPAPALTPARAAADAILQQAEFRRVQRAGYLQRKLAALGLLLDRLFSGAVGLIPQSPWFATLLEWGLLGLAAAGLVLWAWRTSRQQRLAIGAHQHAGQAQWQQESEDWAARARAEAARGEWREAVHSLYWSAIVLLEGQKHWRQNRARTPREYVALLEPGSARQAELNGLTRVFEPIWYGLGLATEDDYTRAVAMLERLRTAA